MANVKFPIKRTIRIWNKDYQKELKENEEVECWFCNHKFKLNKNTVYMDAAESEVAVCPNCHRHVDCFYYFDRKNARLKIPLDPNRKIKQRHFLEMV